MPRRAPSLLLAPFVTLAASAAADTLVLSDGRQIQADSAWVEGEEIRYRQGDRLFTLARSLVERVEPGTAGGEALVDPDLLRSGESLARGDPAEALRLARLAQFRQPASLPVLQALGAAQLALGDTQRARETAEAAIALDERNAASHERLADILVELADFEAARERYKVALGLDPRPSIKSKLDTLSASAAISSSARFRIRYDGDADEPLGLKVLQVLDAAWGEHEKRLGFAPGQPVTVVLQTATAYRDTTRAPEWAAAWNDGTIRVPVMGVEAPSPGLVRVLRHELAHSFVASRAGPNCPTWLHEGIAQWLEGGDPQREDAALVREAGDLPFPRLEALEGPFVGMTEAKVASAYAGSLSIVAHILRLRGERGLRRLLDALADGHPAAEALPVALALSYGELQLAWETFVRRSVRGAGL